MGFLSTLRTILLGNTEKKKTARVNNRSGNNSINNQAILMKAIEKVLKGYYKGQKCSFTDKLLVIWSADGILLDSLQESKFTTELASYLDNEMDAVFAAIELRPGPLPEKHDFTKVQDGIYMEIRNKIKSGVAGKAEITSLPKFGSLIKKKYILDSGEIVNLPTKRYNIGIGEYPALNTFRQNHIAVDDDAESPEFENNKYVSRRHAYIRYSADEGFMLQAEFDGTIKAGKRTRILRQDQTIDVDDIVAQPLKDGDCIELSKNVRLLFKIIN